MGFEEATDNMSETGLTRRQCLMAALAAAVATVGNLMAGLHKSNTSCLTNVIIPERLFENPRPNRYSKQKRFCRIWRTYKPIPVSLLTCVGTTDGNLTITKVSASKIKRNGSRTYRDVTVWYEVKDV